MLAVATARQWLARLTARYIVALWQFGVNAGMVNAFLMGSPSGIWQEFVRLAGKGELLSRIPRLR
ncbi:MAG: hypothetical protein ACSLEN_03840 [Candidatus Malihini olakiniferum]